MESVSLSVNQSISLSVSQSVSQETDSGVFWCRYNSVCHSLAQIKPRQTICLLTN